MKKIYLSALSLVLALIFAACGADTTDLANVSSGVNSREAEQANSDLNSRVLVAYYSATGNTKTAAEYIAEATGGDLFELVPEKPYTADDLKWTDENSRVSFEYSNPDQRQVALVSSVPGNFDEYDIVFIGYPIWWGIAAWPVNEFITSNDFTGKTVIPFCTSASSELGESAELLKTAAGTGNWLDGARFSSGASETEVKEWASEFI